MPHCETCGDEIPEPTVGRYNEGTCWWNAEEEFYLLGPAGLQGVYVEGWAVRPVGDKLEAFEHGWVEVDGQPQPRDVTPHNHAVAYFRGIWSRHPRAESAAGGLGFPLYRIATAPEIDGQPNPRFDGERARAYAKARQDAYDYCGMNQPG